MAEQNLDFNIFKALWININNAVVPPTPPGQPVKACLLLEQPGFSVNPDSLNPDKFDPSKEMHPDRAKAMLADRVPALAPYFYDTGSHISFFWKQFLETFKLKWTPEDDEKLKAKYERAIKMLYGDEEGFINQKKTPFFEELEQLLKKWKVAKQERDKYYEHCQDKDEKKNWPENFQTGAGPEVDKMDQAYIEYENRKSQIEQCEAAIFQYTRGDLSRLLLEQAQSM